MQWEECSGRSDAAGIRFGWASLFLFTSKCGHKLISTEFL